MSSFIATGTSYYNHGVAMIPFFSFYSMFGYQRVGDLCWAAGDMRTRGFMMAGTAGRTTLNGEGLQHQDGHSHLLMHCLPNCRAYDPSFAYELAVIVQDGLRRMYAEGEDVYYYLTMMNENYTHPALPAGAAEGIVRGMYRFSEGDKRLKKRVQLLGSGTILREAIAAVELLAGDWNVAADVWSVPGFGELRRDGLATERWNLLHPEDEPRTSYVAQCLGDAQGPAVAATDYMKAYADLIRPFVPMPYYVLGTDGYGRSDTREVLRDFFEVDRRWITVTALKALADMGEIEPKTVAEAIDKYGIDPDKPEPVTT
jgi:pyruvate dehydrogenase E1 component